MAKKYIKFKDFKYGVVNAIEASEIPQEAVCRSQNFYFRENFWRKLPGLTEINASALGTDPVWSVFRFNQIAPKKSFLMAASGSGVYLFDENTLSFVQIHSGLNPNQQVEFLEYQNQLYFGSQYDLWRKYTGGTVSYSVGGEDGIALDAPRKFSKIIFNPYAGRFFAIGVLENPDYLHFSEHIDNEGIEKFTDANVQLIDSVQGDTPKDIQTFEGRITIISQNSINSGSVVGVPQAWSFQKEKAQTGTVAGRTVKRQGNSFLMLTPNFEVYKWPEDVFITKGRVKFNINPYRAHLACAEIVENRYYLLTFESGEAVSSNKYHTWVYDILGDRWYGPHIQRNVVSMFWDAPKNILLCGGTDDLAGFMFQYRGRNIKNQAMKCSLLSACTDLGYPRVEKRVHKGWVKAKQEGSLPGGTGSLELVFNSDNLYNNPQSQRILLEDPANQNLSDTNAVREAVTKRFHIHDAYGRGNAFQWELKHEVLNGDVSVSELEFETTIKDYQKENRAA